MNAFEHFIMIDQLSAPDRIFMRDQFGASTSCTIDDQLPLQDRFIPRSNDLRLVVRLSLRTRSLALLLIVGVLVLRNFIKKILILLADALIPDVGYGSAIIGRTRNVWCALIGKSGETEN